MSGIKKILHESESCNSSFSRVNYIYEYHSDFFI